MKYYIEFNLTNNGTERWYDNLDEKHVRIFAREITRNSKHKITGQIVSIFDIDGNLEFTVQYPCQVTFFKNTFNERK